MKEFDIKTPMQQAHFIAQLGHESQGFTRVSESFNYSVDGLLVFKNRMTQVQREMLGRKLSERALSAERQKAIANIVYGGRLGNKNSDDGWRFRGRGLMHITFKDNYAECGKGIGLDLLANPDLLLTDIHAARSAGWFWKNKKCNIVADTNNVEAVTKLINGGKNGLNERIQKTANAIGVLCTSK